MKIIKSVGWVLALFFHLGSFNPVAAAEVIDLALNWKPEPEFGGFYAIKEFGLDQKQGLNLNIIPGGAGQPVAQMIASGQVKLGIVSGDEVIIARNRGADIVALFSVYHTSPFAIMTHESQGFKKLEDVFKAEGTLAIQKGLPPAVYLQKKYGFGKLKIVPYAGGVGAFLRDEKFYQQCFVTSEPLIASRQGAKPKTFLISESGFDPYVEVVAAKGDWARSHPKEVAALIQLFQLGWETYFQKTNQVNQTMQKLNPAMTLDVFNKSAEIQKPFIVGPKTKKKNLGSMTSERWQKLSDHLLELKLIDKKVEAKDLWLGWPLLP